MGAAVTRSRGVTRDVAESLPIDNGVDRGEWGPTELCDANSYASAFEIKVRRALGEGNSDTMELHANLCYDKRLEERGREGGREGRKEGCIG